MQTKGYLLVYLSRCGAHAFLYGPRGYVLPLLRACKKRVVLVARVNFPLRMFGYGQPMPAVKHKVVYIRPGAFGPGKQTPYMQQYLNQHAN